jgi:hypothetical protein
MPSCRQIPPEAWAQAFESLVFYFSRRLCVEDAQDLAQQTLLAVARREDYEFEKVDDFQRVCYGFAGKILQAHFQRGGKRIPVPLEPTMQEPEHHAAGAESVEDAIYLKEVLQVGLEQLSERDCLLIQEAAEAQMENRFHNYPPGEANTLRVALHRARKKLAQLTGRGK